ncbi:MAG: hypothetical protein AB7K04_07145 [Pseudorhodoplanes sp.]
MRSAILIAAFIALTGEAVAQDIQGLETCTRESRVERRTGCLQSNDEFLHQLVRRNATETQQKLVAAQNEITALKAALAEMKAALASLQSQKAETPKSDARAKSDAKPKTDAQ